MSPAFEQAGLNVYRSLLIVYLVSYHCRKTFLVIKECLLEKEKANDDRVCSYAPCTMKNSFTMMFSIEIIGTLLNCYVLGSFVATEFTNNLNP